jgi:hypothetical protein
MRVSLTAVLSVTTAKEMELFMPSFLELLAWAILHHPCYLAACLQAAA